MFFTRRRCPQYCRSAVQSLAPWGKCWKTHLSLAILLETRSNYHAIIAIKHGYAKVTFRQKSCANFKKLCFWGKFERKKKNCLFFFKLFRTVTVGLTFILWLQNIDNWFLWSMDRPVVYFLALETMYLCLWGGPFLFRPFWPLLARTLIQKMHFFDLPPKRTFSNNKTTL